LEQYEAAKSIETIAREAKRDTRTIKKGVQLAADERERAQARTQLYRDAMATHNTTLQAALRDVLQHLHVPPLEMLARSAASSDSHALRGLIAVDEGIYVNVIQPGQERVLELLREHLATEKALWRMLDRWTAKLMEYARGGFDVGKAMGEDAVNATGLSFSSSGPRLLYEFVELESLMAEQIVSGKRQPLSEADVDAVGGQVTCDACAIAFAVPKELLLRCAAVFASSANSLACSPEFRDLLKLKGDLARELQPIRRGLEDYQLLGMIPGRCSICQKLGF
jgi:hypothetical protein